MIDRQLRQNEEELRKGNVFNLAILNSITSEIAVLNQHGVIIAVNESWKRFALENSAEPGKPALHTEIGTNYLAICQSCIDSMSDEAMNDASKAIEGIESVLAGRSNSFSLEYDCHSPEKKRWFSMSVTPLGQDDNGVVVTHTDITDRKLAEEEARSKDKQLYELSSRLPGLVFQFIARQDGTRTVEYVTGQVEKMFGLSPEPQDFFERFTTAILAENRNDFLQNIEKTVSEGAEWNYEGEIQKPSGEILWISGIASPTKMPDSIIYNGVIIDITQRKRAEQNYRTLFREMLDGFALHEIICNEAGKPIDYRFIEVNPAFELQSGLKAIDIIGRTALETIPDIEQYWIETFGKVALTGKPTSFENYSRGIQKHFLVTAFRPAPGQFACIFADITERKKAEAERQKLEAQLQQAQKMEAIGTLAGGIAHDFNNILGAILGYAEMAQEDSPAGSILRQDIDRILNASHRARELVKQILAFSRQVETEYKPLQPAFIIQEAIRMLRSSLPSTIDIKENINTDVGHILASPTQIHQIIMNLGTNAFHAMEETGGILAISLEKKTLDEIDIVDKPGVQSGNFVQLSIGDTGPGIDPALWDKIFNPYFTTKEVGKGTGMGLAIIHGIVKSYGGWVSFKSHPGKGTIFEVLLPVMAEEAVVEIKSEKTVQGGNERILFIDDEELLAEMGKSMLERLGYQVTIQSSSLEALTTFQNQPDKFDLVITDQTMPGMTGIDMARRMLQIRPGMPIILCTGYSSLISKDKAKSLGIKGFAMKPLAKKDIAQLIREVLTGERAPMAKN